jgi:isopentenyl-diphosphate delta-isomerase
MPEMVILVDESDRETGTEEKLIAHQNGGKLHRSISIYVFDSVGRLLIQKRSSAKYHSASLWSNTCCSHPRPGEAVMAAAHRRLVEEMGIDCEMKDVLGFLYKGDVGSGLIEWEYGHVIVGRYDGTPQINEEEVDDWRWVDVDWLEHDIQNHAENYTAWLGSVLDAVKHYLVNAKDNPSQKFRIVKSY